MLNLPHNRGGYIAMSKHDINEAEKIFSGEKILKLRNQKGLSRQQVRELTKIPSRTLEDWEYGNTVPTKLSSLRLLAEVLNCSLQDFCYDGIVLDPKYKQCKDILNPEEVNFLIGLLKKSLEACDNEKESCFINSIIDKLS